MSAESLIAEFGVEPGTGDRIPVVLIMLEQGALDNYVGYMTKKALVAYIHNLVFGFNDAIDVNCGLSLGGTFDTTINAYPYYPDLNYKLLASYGTLGEPEIEEIERTELVQILLNNDAEVKYPIHEIISAEWSGDAYDAEMGIISPQPDITLGEEFKTVRSSIPCYGLVQVKYTTIVHRYPLEITPRLNTDYNKYTSVVFAVYDGGLVWLQTEAPPGAEETEGDCFSGDTVDFGPDDDDKKPPTGEDADMVIRIDYCTGRELERYLT